VVNETAPISESIEEPIETADDAPLEDDVIDDVEDTVEETEPSAYDEVMSAIEGKYASADDVERIKPMLGRYTKTLDQLQNQTQGMVSREELSAVSQQLSQMRDLLELGLKDSAPDEVLNEIRNQRYESDKASDRTQLRQEILQELGTTSSKRASQGEITQGEAQVASQQVIAYARGKGVDAADIPNAVWDMKPNQSMQQAISIAEGAIDELVQEKSSSARRTRKKSADPQNGSSPNPAASGSSHKGLTLEKLSKMSRDEINNIPKEVVDKVLATPS